MHLRGTHFGEKKSWTGLGDWSGRLEENYFHVHRGYCLPGKGIRKGISTEILAAYGTQREPVWDEFGEADLNKSHRRVFSQEMYLLDQDGNKLSRRSLSRLLCSGGAGPKAAMMITRMTSVMICFE